MSRLEILLEGLIFIATGMIKPRKAWAKMHDTSLYAMLDSDD